MKQRELPSYSAFKVGDDLTVASETGFHAGQARQRGKLKRIVMTEWTEEEAIRLNVPPVEIVYVFEDGSTAGSYDQVWLTGF